MIIRIIGDAGSQVPPQDLAIEHVDRQPVKSRGDMRRGRIRPCASGLLSR